MQVPQQALTAALEEPAVGFSHGGPGLPMQAPQQALSAAWEEELATDCDRIFYQECCDLNMNNFEVYERLIIIHHFTTQSLLLLLCCARLRE